jgi:hypothetical protein
MRHLGTFAAGQEGRDGCSATGPGLRSTLEGDAVAPGPVLLVERWIPSASREEVEHPPGEQSCALRVVEEQHLGHLALLFRGRGKRSKTTPDPETSEANLFPQRPLARPRRSILRATNRPTSRATVFWPRRYLRPVLVAELPIDRRAKARLPPTTRGTTSEPRLPRVTTRQSSIPANTRSPNPKSRATSPISTKRLPTNSLTLPTRGMDGSEGTLSG